LALSLLAESYMLKIQRSSNGQVVFTLSGQIDVEHIAELETFIRAEANAQSIVLDLKDVTLAGRDAVSFLEHCEAEGVTLRNCAAYVREWITRQRRGR
jgi:anti-anti-sigma regulatory factor